MNIELRSKLDASFDLLRRVPLTKLGVLERSKKTIKDLQIGSVLNYLGVAYMVTDKYTYYSTKKDVVDGVEFQIKNLLDGEISYLEYSEDDIVEIFITISEVSGKEMGKALPKASYQFLKDEVKDFTLKSANYYYDDNWKSRFVRNGKTLSESELVSMVEFESEDELTYLTFEFWEDGSMEIFISKELQSYNIEILSL